MLSLWKYFIPPVNLICCSFTYILSKLILPVYWYRQSGSEMCPTEILLGTPCSPALSQFKYKEACLQWICSALIKAAEFSFSECLRSVWVSGTSKVCRKLLFMALWKIRTVMSRHYCFAIIFFGFFLTSGCQKLWFLYVLRRESNKTLEAHKKCLVFL